MGGRRWGGGVHHHLLEGEQLLRGHGQGLQGQEVSEWGARGLNGTFFRFPF